MNWNSSEFVWLDWAVLVIGVILIAWAVYRAIQKDKKQQQGARSQGRRWYGTLGDAGLDDSYPRMAVRPLLSIIEQ